MYLSYTKERHGKAKKEHKALFLLSRVLGAVDSHPRPIQDLIHVVLFSISRVDDVSPEFSKRTDIKLGG